MAAGQRGQDRDCVRVSVTFFYLISNIKLQYTLVQTHINSLPTSNVLHNYRSEGRHLPRPAERSLSQLFIDEGSCRKFVEN